MHANEKVLVIGLSKTGTSTLNVMLSELGYRVCHQRKDLLRKVRAGNFAALDPVLDAYDAFEDWPWPLAYRHALARYGSRAKFILTTRSSAEKWFASVNNHGYRMNLFKSMKQTYGRYRPFGRSREFSQIYENHNAEVREFFASHPEQFLEFCLENGDGWQKLCDFLGKPVPGVPVPHANQTTPDLRKVQRICNEIIAPVYRLLP